MSGPAPLPDAPNMVVTCYTCVTAVAMGNDITDGQPHLTEYADRSCKRDDCPHKTAAVEARKRQQPATLADLDALKTRVSALERKPNA
jgi:hypothetical protein